MAASRSIASETVRLEEVTNVDDEASVEFVVEVVGLETDGMEEEEETVALAQVLGKEICLFITGDVCTGFSITC